MDATRNDGVVEAAVEIDALAEDELENEDEPGTVAESASEEASDADSSASDDGEVAASPEAADVAAVGDVADVPQPRSVEPEPSSPEPSSPEPSAKAKKRKSAPRTAKSAAGTKALVVFRDGKVHYADESVVVLDLDDAAHPDTDVHDVVDKLSELRDAADSAGRTEAITLVADLIQAKALA